MEVSSRSFHCKGGLFSCGVNRFFLFCPKMTSPQMSPDPLIQEGGRESTFRPTVLFIVQRYLRRATHTLPSLRLTLKGKARPLSQIPFSFLLSPGTWREKKEKSGGEGINLPFGRRKWGGEENKAAGKEGQGRIVPKRKGRSILMKSTSNLNERCSKMFYL